MLVRAGPRRLPVPAPVALLSFSMIWLLLGMCCAHFCWHGGGGGPPSLARVLRICWGNMLCMRHTIRIRSGGLRAGGDAHAYVRKSSAARRPPRGKRSISIFIDWTDGAHALAPRLPGGQVYAKPHREREAASIETAEAFNTVKNSISKIATCLRAGERERERD